MAPVRCCCRFAARPKRHCSSPAPSGHLRSIIGGLTVEQIIRERDRVAQEVKDGSQATAIPSAEVKAEVNQSANGSNQ
jgi:regulator of protease activity HflC (stomatin/prohibitin superfamily)